MSEKKGKAIWDLKIVRGAVWESILKLNPRKMMGNPVMRRTFPRGIALGFGSICNTDRQRNPVKGIRVTNFGRKPIAPSGRHMGHTFCLSAKA